MLYTVMENSFTAIATKNGWCNIRCKCTVAELQLFLLFISLVKVIRQKRKRCWQDDLFIAHSVMICLSIHSMLCYDDEEDEKSIKRKLHESLSYDFFSSSSFQRNYPKYSIIARLVLEVIQKSKHIWRSLRNSFDTTLVFDTKYPF